MPSVGSTNQVSKKLDQFSLPGHEDLSIMKILFSFGFVLIAAQADAFVISGLNIPFADPSAVPVLDRTGVPIAVGSGYVAVGTYLSAPTTATEAKNQFIPIGTGTTVFRNSLASGSGIDGFFDLSWRESLPFGTSAFPVGERVYLIIGEGISLAESNQIALFDSVQVLGTENEVGLGALDIIIDDAVLTPDRLMIGSIVENVDIGLPVTFNETIQLVSIPEPSTGLLVALASFGLVGRRRRSER